MDQYYGTESKDSPENQLVPVSPIQDGVLQAGKDRITKKRFDD